MKSTSINVSSALLLLALFIHNHVSVSALSFHSGIVMGARSSSTRLSMKAADNKYSIGLALAGGGNRASSTCIGFLRGFQQKQITKNDGTTCSAMDLVKYNSGISGGSVPALLYSFAHVPTEELLETDRKVEPDQITTKLLEELPKTSLGYPITTNPLRLPQVERLRFIFSKLTKVHSYWSGIVNRNFCRPLGIPSNKLFAANEADVEEILKENPKLKQSDFIVPRPDTKAQPMLLFTLKGTRADFGTFMEQSQAAIGDAWDEYMRDETMSYFFKNGANTPPSLTEKLLQSREDHDGCLPAPYTVTPSEVRTMYKGTMELGPITKTFPLEDVKPYKWGTRSRFSVEAALAMSTNFLGLSEGLTGQLLTNVRKIDGVTTAFADGGLSDLCGILPLVQYKVQKIICVFNFNQNPPYANFDTKYSDFYKAGPCTSIKDPDFDMCFKEWLKLLDPRISCYFGYFGGKCVDCTVLNHVFKDPKLDRLKELMVTYNSLFEAGEPLIATLRNLETVENPFWGIEAGDRIDLTFIYMNMPKQFSSHVPTEVVPPPEETMDKIDEHGQFTNEAMSKVPELPWSPPVEGIKYSNEQVNMISYLGSWMVHRAWEPVTGIDGRVKFRGFKEIFNPDQVVEP